VNNAIARAAMLTALAVIPVVSGLVAATTTAGVTHAYRVSLVIAAGIAAAASVVSFVGLGSGVRVTRGARRVHCAVDGAPLQADPNRCPEVIAA